MSIEFTSPANGTVYQVLLERYSGRTVKGTTYRLGAVYSQVYATGPVAWRVSLHSDHKGGEGPHAGQLTIECRRKGGAIRVFGEPRRNPRSGDRYALGKPHAAFLGRLAPIVEAALEEAEHYNNPDPAYAPPAPKKTKAEEVAPDATIFDLFGADDEA